jgi:gamma-glutamylcyclotransferase (GGCT)/AIG2-like uncharacterized protein YtfP
MPLVFSYGSLQDEDVQKRTLGRAVRGFRDELRGFEPTQVAIQDPTVAAALGKTHHENVVRNGSDESRVPGTVLEVTDDELARIDRYEADDSYRRIAVVLASGAHAWVYVYSEPS